MLGADRVERLAGLEPSGFTAWISARLPRMETKAILSPILWDGGVAAGVKRGLALTSSVSPQAEGRRPARAIAVSANPGKAEKRR